MAHGVALDAREKRFNELKWLYDAEEDVLQKKVVFNTMKEMIIKEPPKNEIVGDSDDEKQIAFIPPSAKVVHRSSFNSNDTFSATPVTELWGDDADSDSGDDAGYYEPRCDRHFENERSAMKENDRHFENERSAMKENDRHFENERSAMKENDRHFENDRSAMKENDRHFENERSAMKENKYFGKVKSVMKEKEKFDKDESDDDINEVNFFAPEPPKKLRKKSNSIFKKK